MEILKNIDMWKLDAKQEESDRYFYNLDQFESIKNGDKNYIIGRKGTGKTALAEYINKITDYNNFSVKLTFKNFPFNELYRLENNDYTRPNQYISLWKYLIYSSICRMMVQNQNIDLDVRTTLEELFGSASPITNLKRVVKQWTAKEYDLKFLGVGGKLSLDKNEQTWLERLDVLEDIITEYLDDSYYYIVFDELDEDYKNIVELGNQSDYISLITSLFKAVQDIRSIFLNTGKNIRPIIFLRDDIYDLILDPDKNKWDDFRSDLDWDIHKIKQLLAFRISRAIDPAGKILSFNNAWSAVFNNDPVGVGTRAKKKIEIFDYITNSTQLRPRDYVRYLQVAAHESIIKNSSKISPATVKKVDKGFSNYLKSELVDEIHGILPDIQEIFSIISEIRKWLFSIEEFKKIYQQRINNGTVTIKDVDFVLKILFHFSVIGNQARMGVNFFRYNNKEARFNFNEKIVVHRGLFKALQII